jgi:hypothetical protein
MVPRDLPVLLVPKVLPALQAIPEVWVQPVPPGVPVQLEMLEPTAPPVQREQQEPREELGQLVQPVLMV